MMPIQDTACNSQAHYFTVWTVLSSHRPGMTKDNTDTRQKILQATEELARENGPGNIALDAVAARAGISKGGLLYHFPTKAHLLKAMVEDFLHRFDTVLREEERNGRPNGVIRAYLDHYVQEHQCKAPPPSGLLAALAEDPDLLTPVRRYERDFLDRIRANATDPQLATVAFLVLHGIRNMRLLNVPVIDKEETESVIRWLRQNLELPES